ncbi:MAG: U32 family peptidase [Oscillospiraceae bacterium]|nr:U32 family peptidase [Oscillospiraceae bacterium]
MLELLAPAGSMEALRAAVQNGANAVYLGCGQFNARQSAKNFTPQSLAEAVKYCHVRGVAVHLTLNTLVSDKETPDVITLIRQAAQCGVDAFIVQDLGVVRLCREIAPDVPVHGSTQMTIHSLPGVKLCAAWGFTRVVLSRELSREEIRYICANSPIEIEVFGHGALCMGYSGQCYLSAAIGGRSGNRGRCAQPCRQSYGYDRWQNRHPLSLKDNCLVHYVKDLEEMGVASLKLEGRMKRPEYVAAVTQVYRQAIDTGVVTRNMEKQLMDAFNRQGFTDGYYKGQIGSHMFGIREEKNENQPWMKEIRQSYETAENGLVPVVFHMTVHPAGSQLSVTDPNGRVVTLDGPVPEVARTVALTREDLVSRLSKTGGTPYRCLNVIAEVAPGLTLSAAAINAMRRDVLNLLTAQRARHQEPRLLKPEKLPKRAGAKTHPELTIQVTSKEQITGRLLKMAPAMLYVPVHVLMEDLEFTLRLTQKVPVCAVAPRIVHDGELANLKTALLTVKEYGVQDVLIGNLALLITAKECRMNVRGDFGLNLYNSGAMEVARALGMASACLSFEMTLPQIRDISKAVPTEMLVYGRMPLMLTENCLIRGKTGQFTCHLGPAKLTDKTGAEFPIIKDGNSCRSVLLNGKKLNLLDRQGDLSRLGLWATRLYFTTENAKEVDRVLGCVLNPMPFDPGASTRGLYLRGVE